MRSTFALVFLLLISSCKLPGTDRPYTDPSKKFKLHLQPQTPSAYRYEVSNQTIITVEVDDKEVENVNKANFETTFNISKDSNQHFVYLINYDKLHAYSKKGNVESEADANNGMVSINLLDRMLALLKQTTITATIDSTGKLLAVKGYEEFGARLLSSIQSADPYAYKSAQIQVEKVIGDGMIKQNIDQFLMFFPDSAIYVGETWKLSGTLKSDVPLSTKTVYSLESIENGFAVIDVKAVVKTTNDNGMVLGYNATALELSGNQEGKIQVEIKTGMLKSSSLISNLTGSITAMGRTIPVEMTSTIKVDQK